MDESIEKPWLICHPCSERLPLVLSGGNVHPPIQVPASITRFLRDYQINGVRFLYNRFKEEEGGLLADDMGLGKTVQAIAFIAAVLHMKGTIEDKLRHCSEYIRNDIAPGTEVPSVNPVLIICPASLTDNWIYEFHTWGYFKVNKITSSNKLELINQAMRRECDVIIVTFETARNIIRDLNSVDWTCVLVDEVHKIKETKSQVSKALSSLHCKRRFGFTGTPFQNNIKEIYTLLKWSSPEAISKFSQSHDISRLMEQGLRSSATLLDCAEKSIAQFQFSEVRSRLMMRRTKDILAKHLPSKTDQIVFCELTKVQQNIYRMITQSTDVQRWLGKDDCKKKHPQKSQTGLLFTYLHLLQKTANHVGLLASGLSSKTNDVARRVCEEALGQFAGLEGTPKKSWVDALADVNMSGKMLVLSKLLPSFLEKGDKILLFSYSTKVLDLVQKHLSKMRFKFWRLDGSTPVDSRLSLVTSFNMYPHPAIFLLSTKAGGVGLNMTGANVVIIFDPNWNPAHDLQAQDRLGQQRDVRVYRLLSTATLEEFIYLRQVYKQQLGSVSMTDQNTRRYFDGELFGVKNLFSFRESNRSLTEELLEKQQKLELRLRLKLEAPLKEGSSKVSFSPSALALNGKGNEDGEKRSGFTQLLRHMFRNSDDHCVMDESEDSLEDGEDEENSHDESYGNCDESIATLLERTSEVRHVVRHQNVIAPSKVEDFVADCAIRDVFEKKINFQRPAFDCSLEIEDEMTDEEQAERKTSLQSIMCRLKFNQFAKMEFLTDYQLAAKVMAMSTREKENLLRKHQKRHLKPAEIPWKGKRARLISLTGVEDESAVRTSKVSLTTSMKELEHVTNMSKKATIMDHGSQPSELLIDAQHQSGLSEESKHKGDKDTFHVSSESGPLARPIDESMANVNETSVGAKFSSQLSNCSESSSSFERQAKEDCPGLSKNAIKVMEGWFSSRSETSVQSRPKSKEDSETQSDSNSKDELISLPTQGTESIKTLSDKCKDKEIRVDLEDCAPEIDETIGCSKTAIAFIDSLLVTAKRLPSPQKKSRTSIAKAHHVVPHGDHDIEAVSEPSFWGSLTCSSNVMVNAGTKSVSKLSYPAKTQFRAEDDCYQKLINSGKLKLNKKC